MRSTSRDLTVDTVLDDPLIRVVMRADRVDPRDLEALLRAAAFRRAAPAPLPAGVVAAKACGLLTRVCDA